MSAPKVEWIVAYLDTQNTLHTASHGAQSVFSLPEAEKLARRLGPPWSAYHHLSKRSPEEHAQQELLQVSNDVAGPTWGSGWSQ